MKPTIINNKIIEISTEPKTQIIPISEEDNKLEDKCKWLICPRCKEFPIITPIISSKKEVTPQEGGIISIKCRCNKYTEFSLSISEYLSKIETKQKEKSKCTYDSSHNIYQAINYCFQCEVFMCSICYNLHKTLHKDHIVSDEGVRIDKICDRHLKENKIVSYCEECKMNLCPSCLKDHNIHHQIYDMKEIFPKSLYDKTFNQFTIMKNNVFDIIEKSKMNIEELITKYENNNTIPANDNEKEKVEEEKKEIKKLQNQMNSSYKKNIKTNQDFIKIISLMFENYSNTVESTPNFNLINNLKNITRFNTGMKQFQIEDTLSLIDNIKNFISYLDTTGFIIKTINTPLKLKEKIEIKKLKNIKSLESFHDSLIFIGNWESEIHIVDLKKKEVVQTITGHFGGIDTLCLVNKKYLASGGRDFCINLYEPDIEKNKEEEGEGNIYYKGFLSGHDGNVSRIIQLKDGKIVSCGWDKKIKVFGKIIENEAREILPQIVENNPDEEEGGKEVSISNINNDKKKLVAKNNNNEGKKENKEKEEDNENKENKEEEKNEKKKYYTTFEELKIFSSHKEIVLDIVELKDGSLMSCSDDKTLKIFNMETLKEIKTIPVNFMPNKLLCLPDGRICIAYKKDRENKYTVGIYKINENYEITLEKEFSEDCRAITSLLRLDDGKIVSISIDGNAIFYNPFDMSIVCKININENKGMISVTELEDRTVAISSGYNYLYILE